MKTALFQHLICQLLTIFFRSWIHKDCILKSLSSVNVLRGIRKFHVVVLQWRQRNIHNSLMHVQSCCFAVLACWRRRCCLSSPISNETTPSWIDKHYACATSSSPLEDHYHTEKSDCFSFNTWYVEFNSPSSRATTVNSPTDSFLCSIFCWYYVNECRDTRGNRGRN